MSFVCFCDVLPTYSPLSGHALLLHAPYLYTSPPSVWSHCGEAAWTSCRHAGGATRGRVRLLRERVPPARVRAAGWTAHWKAGNPHGNWRGPASVRFAPRCTVSVYWVRSAAGILQIADSCLLWKGTPPTLNLLELQSSRCWIVWSARVWKSTDSRYSKKVLRNMSLVFSK